MKNLKFIVLILFTIKTYAQEKSILVFDIVNGSMDSITNVQYDSTIVNDKTDYYIGNFNSNIESLEQVPPISNIYTNSQFTFKKRAAEDFDLTNYPIRTSVKIFSVNNDTLNSNCSGSIISRRHVFTAAHCVSNLNTNTLSVDSLYVCPIFDNGNINSNFNCSYVEKIYIFRDWKMSGEDFAILELAEPLGETTGWISIGFNSIDSVFTEGIYYKFSYPATTILYLDSNEYNGDTLYYNYGNIDIVDDNFIGINHTNGILGESGSSLINVENNQNYTSYGVLSYSTSLRHCKLNNWKYYSLESIIHDDLIFSVSTLRQENCFTVFPNPSKDKICIRNTENIEILEIVFIDAWGRKVFSKTINNFSSDIDITNFPNGLYYLIIKTSNSQISKKIIIHGS